jgi:hypothetical protein
VALPVAGRRLPGSGAAVIRTASGPEFYRHPSAGDPTRRLPHGGGLDKALWYTADWDLYLKIASIGNICYHSTPLACFRVHRNSLTVLGSRDIHDFRKQHTAIVDRHIDKLLPDSRTATLRISAASIEVNVALAAAVAGKFGAFSKAIRSVLFLGPAGIARYLSYSRIVDRALPRLRAAVAGRF